jgi:membrane-associated phospholipid phosphatase
VGPTSAVRLVDTEVLRHLSGGHSGSKHVASALSRVAQLGVGWHVLTALLVLRPGAARRVGIAGSSSWLIAQAGTAALKPLIGRRRPSLPALGPAVTSPSMPSTHAASGLAYATAGLLQHRAATALLVPAGGVAWSRVRTRRHFGSDVAVGVVAGCLIGIGIGIAVRRLGDRGWPGLDRPRPEAVASPSPGGLIRRPRRSAR